MRIIPALACALAAGCATTGADLRGREPVATYTTDKTAAEVTRCLVEHIRNYGNPGVMEDDRGTTVTFIERDAATLVWEISPDRTVRVWRLHGLVPYREAAERCV